jgi:hypothetical protein
MRGVGRSIGFACGAAVLLAFAALSPRLVPYNMDEFVHYHALGCASAPLQRGLPAFRDGCGLYDLRLPLTRTPLPLRSYYYIGSFPAVPFYPFWRLLGDPLAVRLQGAVFFLAWIALVARLLRVPLSVAAGASLVVPTLLVTFLVDEGPVGLAALLFAGGLLAIRRAVALGDRGSPRWGALGGLLLFLGLWSKLVFACLLPAVVLFTLEEIRSREGSWRLVARRRSALAGIALGLLLPSTLLLASSDSEGRPYAAALERSRVSIRPSEVAERFARLVSVATEPRLSAARNVELAPSRLDLLPPVLCAAVLLVVARQRQARRREIAGWTALSVLTLGLLSLSAYCQWPHHAFYGLLLLALALALALDAAGPGARWALAVLVLAGWASLAARWAGGASYPTESAPGKDELLRFVRQSGLDRGTLQVHTSWGTYYVAQLFGDPARMVVYLRALSEDPVQLAQVRELAREHGRPLLMVGSRRWERFQTPSLAALVGEPSRRWTFGEWWVAEYPVPGAPQATSASPRP